VLFDEKKFRESLPLEMLKEKRFVRYFLKAKPEGGTAKIPLGNHSDPNTWSTFDDCVKQLENADQGIGYNFLGGDILGLDIDHCRNPRTGQLCNEAMVLLSRIPSWAEYSVSGQGIHVFFKGNVRGKQLTETCLQFWNPKNSPRFFALTCDMVGDAFTKLKDVGEEFNYIFATARHISAKIREELRAIDYEQWAALPAERQQLDEQPREKSKTKTRKLHKEFNLEDFLKFYGLPVDNVVNNMLGKCFRLRTCPIKGEPHVGQNSTTTNFVLSTDGGLGFHCQSTGCTEYSVSDVIDMLAKSEAGPYPGKIYQEVKKQEEDNKKVIEYKLTSLDEVSEAELSWLWREFLPSNKLVHFAGASSEGKSPVTLDLIARVTSGKAWPDGTPNDNPGTVILMAGEDDIADTVKPRLRIAGADMKRVLLFKPYIPKEERDIELSVAIDRDYKGLVKAVREVQDLRLIVIDPITNYLGAAGMNKEDEIRGSVSMPLVELAHSSNICIITVGHLNKRGADATVLQRAMGAAAFTGVARKVFAFGNDPEEEDKYAHIMGEVRDKAVAIKYSTLKVDDPDGVQKSQIVTVQWGDKTEVDMDAVVNAPKQSEKRTARKIRDLIKIILRDGEKSSEDIQQALTEAGIDPKYQWQVPAGKVAKSRKAGKDKGGKWFWYLPTAEQIKFDGDK
jgi:AAA domain